MSNSSYIQEMWDRLIAVERQALACLGEEKGNQFVSIANDAVEINGMLVTTYPKEELQKSLVVLAAMGVFKEVCWFQLLFLAGNYALLNARLRFVWESIFRAFWAESELGPEAAGLSIDEKVAWLAEKENGLNWNNCIGPTLRKVFPLADTEPDVRDHYRKLWSDLNEYVHPSMKVAGRLIRTERLVLVDGFDEEWALETLDVGRRVFDLVWLAVLQTFPRAWDRLEELEVEYPVLQLVFDDATAT